MYSIDFCSIVLALSFISRLLPTLFIYLPALYVCSLRRKSAQCLIFTDKMSNNKESEKSSIIPDFCLHFVCIVNGQLAVQCLERKALMCDMHCYNTYYAFIILLERNSQCCSYRHPLVENFPAFSESFQQLSRLG